MYNEVQVKEVVCEFEEEQKRQALQLRFGVSEGDQGPSG